MQTEENYSVIISEKAVESIEYSFVDGEYIQMVIANKSDSLTIVPLPAGNYKIQSFRIQIPGGLSSYRFGSDKTFSIEPARGTYIGDYKGVVEKTSFLTERLRVQTLNRSNEILKEHRLEDSFNVHITPIDIIDEEQHL
ncbi:MAG: hypothetical protein OCD01_19440 [Fibrobacterales bacterium]